MLLKIITVILPWPLKRWALKRWFGFDIHPRAKIGMSWIFPRKLIMEADSRIDHFCVAIHLDQIVLGKNATIGRGNWITGLSAFNDSAHFRHQSERRAELWIGESASVTKNHHLDCTNLIQIGSFATLAGYNSQLLTHSIDIMENRQDSAPIYIGEYTFVGTNVVVLGGSSLPSHSVLGAKSLLNKRFSEGWTLYGGVPAKALKTIPLHAKYLRRKDGFVF